MIERHPGTSIHPRARGIHSRSMEILRSLGLDEAVRKAGAAVARNSYFLVVESLAGAEHKRMSRGVDIGTAEADREQITPLRSCMCAQDDLEPILTASAREHGADLRFGQELLSLQQDDAGVHAQVRIRASGAEYSVNAQYLIAADGSRSMVRQSLGGTVEGRGTLDHFVNIYFRADLSALVQGREFILCFIDNSNAHPEVRGSVLLSVNNTDRWLVNVPYDPARGEATRTFTPEHCQELIRQAVGLPDLDPGIIGILPWEAAIYVANQFQYERIFLVGDAAHVMPPTGAFGMNTGLQDAHNLTWKLAAVLKGQAGPELLATYEAERRPVAQFTTTQAGLRSDNQTYTAGQHNEGGMVDDLVVVLGYRYHSAAIIDVPGAALVAPSLDLHGQPGSRAPHAWLERSGQRISTLDLFGFHFVLLCGSNGDAWYEAAQGVAATRGLELDVYSVGNGGELTDPDGRWHDTYGITSSGAVLVRPDGFVGWRTEQLTGDVQINITKVLQQILCK
jgi:putative polyketide hydroxylase